MKTFKKSAALSAALIGLLAASSMAVALPKGPSAHTGSAASEVTFASHERGKKQEAKAEHKHKHKKKAHKAKKVKKVEKKSDKKAAEKTAKKVDKKADDKK
ncbi:hypothetical protein [Hyphomicrobium sp. LHD-15]|uniref:hypothetical protein n=1 Tax=Hyphomicrobium sp. LHD-15 TaxID=3072142 RepID=UPI00280FEAC2|nr:hypothetical protein [Hyphomicrobium sp. LHD-15]MDQ8698008.1 hypothetical protein [Hyphomicrobium sp. LHD-15]